MEKGYKEGIYLVLLFTLMFAAGREMAKVRTGRTVNTFTVAGQAENWGLGFGAEGTQPTGNTTSEELKKYDAYYVGNKEEKVIYLTFDCG